MTSAQQSLGWAEFGIWNLPSDTGRGHGAAAVPGPPSSGLRPDNRSPPSFRPAGNGALEKLFPLFLLFPSRAAGAAAPLEARGIYGLSSLLLIQIFICPGLITDI